MTVTYTHRVATCTGVGCFWKLLFRWRGSIYKLVWPDLLIYSTLYAAGSVVYRVALNEEQRRVFEGIAVHCQQFTDLIPLAFVLGFYVSIVIKRWWEQYQLLPWPDALALFVSTCIVGQNDRSRLMRRTIMRYVNLTFVITLSMVSPRVKKRFPTLDHVLEAGFLTESEKKIFDDLNAKTSHPKYWMPLVWAGTLVAHARKERRIRDDFAVKTLIDEIARFRSNCGSILSYDWISIPLVYTQVVTLSVYTFFLGTLMGRQFLDPNQNLPNHTTDLYVPIFTFLQFFFYMGWLKVAETLVNPFGEDDDDFEVNWLIDRNLQVSYLIVDEMHEEHPDLIPDMYWDVFPHELPYTVATEHLKRDAPQGSTFNMEIEEQDQEMLLPVLEEEESDENLEDKDETKINMRTASDTSLQSLGSGLAMKPLKSSIGSRRGSFLSSVIQRATTTRESRKSSSSSSVRRRTIRHNPSILSNVKSGDSIARTTTVSSLGPKRMSFASQNAQVHPSDSPGKRSVSQHLISKEDWLSPNFEKEVVVDDDGAIVITIKPAAVLSATGTPRSADILIRAGDIQQHVEEDDIPPVLIPSVPLPTEEGDSNSSTVTGGTSVLKPPASPNQKDTADTVEPKGGGVNVQRMLSQDLGSDESANDKWSDASVSDENEDRKGNRRRSRKNRFLSSLPGARFFTQKEGSSRPGSRRVKDVNSDHRPRSFSDTTNRNARVSPLPPGTESPPIPGTVFMARETSPSHSPRQLGSAGSLRGSPNHSRHPRMAGTGGSPVIIRVPSVADIPEDTNGNEGELPGGVLPSEPTDNDIIALINDTEDIPYVDQKQNDDDDIV